MRALVQLQKEFQEYIYREAGAIRAQVIGTQQASADVRLKIYHDAYRLRLLECLQNDYPVLAALAGEEGFERLGLAYIESHPSPYPNVRWYGDEMAEFLKRTAPWRKRPALAEMASFEWAMTLAFDAQDAPVLSVDAIAAVAAEAWPRLRFTPHPSLRRLALQWNAPAIWKALDAKHEPPKPKRSRSALAWLLWRRELQIYFRSLERHEAWALDSLCAGNCFAEICEGLCHWVPEARAPQRAAELLKRWALDGMLSGLSFAD